MLISNAYAQAAGQDAGSGLIGLLPIVLMFVVLWYLMIRPQMKKAKEHQKIVSELQAGDEVITQGGMAGKIVKISDNYVTLAVAEFKDVPIEVQIQRQAVGALLPKGTLKNLQ